METASHKKHSEHGQRVLFPGRLIAIVLVSVVRGKWEPSCLRAQASTPSRSATEKKGTMRLPCLAALHHCFNMVPTADGTIPQPRRALDLFVLVASALDASHALCCANTFSL